MSEILAQTSAGVENIQTANSMLHNFEKMVHSLQGRGLNIPSRQVTN